MIFKSSDSNSVSWIVVFLGNPGSKYDGSRHNVGFSTADVCEKKYSVSINRLKFKALVGTCNIGGSKVLMMKPQTYMNLSGEAVIQAVNFYKVDPSHVLVISDDISIDVGRIRIRRSGSAGGHNGLKSIIQHLGTDGFPRIKIGVGHPDNPDYDMPDWVLGKFHGSDAETIIKVYTKAAEAIECYIQNGPDRTMNLYNN